jgi:hypothetical protein
VVKPFKRYKAMRNNSMPDLTELHPRLPTHTRAERQFAYNKWFIKPEQRLARKPITRLPNTPLAPNGPCFY